MRRLPLVGTLRLLALLSCLVASAGCGGLKESFCRSLTFGIDPDCLSSSQAAAPQTVLEVDLTSGERQALPGSPLPATGRAAAVGMVPDESGSILYRVEMASGLEAILMGSGARGGPPFDSRVLAWDDASQTLCLAGADLASLLVGNPYTGHRELLSGNDRGRGPAIDRLVAIALDPGEGVAYALDGGLARLLAVDLGNGDRRLVSGDATGGGPPMLAPELLAIEVATRIAYVKDGPSVISIHLETGDRALRSGADDPGPELGPSAEMELDETGTRLFVTLR